MSFRRIWIVVTVLISLVAPVHAQTVPGVTADTIVIGQSAAFSGPAARLGQNMRDGASLYFDHINRKGGVHGRKIKLVSLDDGYEPERAVANTKQLIGQEGVFALFGYVGTPTSYAVMPIITDAKVPFFGAFTGAEGLRTPFNRYIFNVRASYYQETEALVKYLVANRKQRIAVFYQDDSYGKAGLSGVQAAMERRKLPIVALGTVQRNTVDVAAAVRTIAKEKPQAIVMISAYTSCAAFIKEMNKTGLKAEYLNVSFVGSDALAEELGPDGHGVLISQVVPYPQDRQFPIADDFTLTAKKFAPKLKLSFNNLEGYIAAKAFVEGLERAGPTLTRDSFINALETFDKVDFGNFRLSFSPRSHNGSDFVGLTIIVGGKGGFLPLRGTAAGAR